MEEHLRYVPAYVSPLTHDEHAAIGRLAVLWGQVDWLVDELLVHVIGITIEQRSILVGEKPVGAKLLLIKPGIAKIDDPEIKGDVQRFYDLVNETKSKRNRIFHGVWGWRTLEKERRVEICSRHPSSFEDPARPRNFSDIEKKLCEASRCGWDAVARMKGWPAWQGATRFFHGGPGEPPKWLERWIERDPLRGEILDQNRKAGQLPHLRDLEK